MPGSSPDAPSDRGGRALILRAAGRLADLAEAAEAALVPALEARGYAVERRDLAALAIPDCKGDFGCWTVTPGVCVQPGPHRDVARAIVQSDLVAWITPVTFGGYSSVLKAQLDHCIPLVSPWFTTVGGETHHVARYARYPALLAVGLAEARDPSAEAVFEQLVHRNGINMHAPRCAARVLTRGERDQCPARVDRGLRELAASGRPPVQAPALELAPPAHLEPVPPRRVLLLVGSPLGRSSVSAALVTHLGGLLVERGLSVATEWIHGRLHEDPELRGLSAAVAAADVVVLAAPLYVDSLPAPVTRALELLAAGSVAPGRSRPRLLAIVNCGFPEAVHTDTGVAICRLFARQAGFDWAGSLGIGGGGMFAGRPLAEQGGRAHAVRRALALTADALAAGKVVPAEAHRMVRALPIPAWLYRVLGDRGFRQAARKHRAAADARPYA